MKIISFILFFQCLVGGILGVDGNLVLGPVALESELEKGPKCLLNMVAKSVVEVTREVCHVIEENVQVSKK